MSQPCESMGPDLAAYISGDLQDRERHRLESHLALCGTCAASESDLRHAWNLMATLPDEEVPEVVIRGVKATIAAERQPATTWQVVVETLLALGLLSMLGIACPIPGVCQFFNQFVAPGLGAEFTFLSHTLTAAAMGMVPLIGAELLMCLMHGSSPLARRQAVGSLYFVLVAFSIPVLNIIPSDPLIIASWSAGTAIAALLGMTTARRLQPLLMHSHA